MQSRSKKLAKVLSALVITSSCFNAAYSNEESYLNSDPININGYVTEAPPATDSELENIKSELRKQKNAIVINKEKTKQYNKLSRSTEKLADTTEEMIEERKESQETIDRFNKKIDCLMAEGFKEGCEEFVKAPKKDEVKLTQASTQVVKEVEAPSTNSDIKVLPYTGMTTFSSENENLEAGFVGGIKIEANISKRFSFGAGFTYTSMSTNDYGNGYIDQSYLGYYNSFYGGREIEYRNMNFDVYSKLFFGENSRFKPYIGAGIGYNRTTVDYTNNDSANPYYGSCSGVVCGYTFGDEEVSTSNFNAQAMLGTEIMFTETVGANIEVSYATGIGGNLSSENGIDAYKAPDQRRLEDLSEELSEADIFRLQAGLLVSF